MFVGIISVVEDCYRIAACAGYVQRVWEIFTEGCRQLLTRVISIGVKCIDRHGCEEEIESLVLR